MFLTNTGMLQLWNCHFPPIFSNIYLRENTNRSAEKKDLDRKFFYELFWKHCAYLNAFFWINSVFPVKSRKHLLLNYISKYQCSCKSEIDPRTNFTRNSVRPSPIHCAPLPFDLGPSRAHFPKISLSFFSARDLKLLSWGDAAGILQECCGDTGGMIRECCGNAAGILRGCCREAVGILLGCCGDAEKI